MSPAPSYLFNVTTRKCEVIYVACITFLLKSAEILKHMDIHIHILHIDI